MTDMVERMKAAMQAAFREKCEIAHLSNDVADALTRAALEALRKPTEEMIKAGDECHTYAPGVSTPVEYAESETVFTAMIDKALEGKSR